MFTNARRFRGSFSLALGALFGACAAALVVALFVAPEWVALLVLAMFAVALLARPGPGAPHWMVRGWFWSE